MRVLPLQDGEIPPLFLDIIVRTLNGGGVVVYPTETFYGLGGGLYSEEGVGKVVEIKGRSEGHPLPLIASSMEQVLSVIEGGEGWPLLLAGRFWPGPVTFVFHSRGGVDERVTAGSGRAGIRITSSKVASAIAGALGSPLTATSANLSGSEPKDDVREVVAELRGEVDLYLDGGMTPGGRPSTVVDLTHPRPELIRDGAVPFERILKIFREITGREG